MRLWRRSAGVARKVEARQDVFAGEYIEICFLLVVASGRDLSNSRGQLSSIVQAL